MLAASRLLARAWWRAGRRTWLANTFAMAAAIAVVLLSAGLAAGTEAGIEERAADLYAGRLRITEGPPAAAPSGMFTAEDRAALAGSGTVAWRLEAPVLVGRRTLLETFLDPEGSLNVSVPGGASPGPAGRTLGIVVGLEADDAVAATGLEPRLAIGRLPGPTDRVDDEVQIILSARSFRSFLSPEELAAMPDPLPRDALRGWRFEVTVGHLEGSGANRDILRAPARVIGLYETGLQPLDEATVFAPIEDVRRLAGLEPQGGAANVAVVASAGVDGATRAAEAQGWSSEGPAAFARRFTGPWLGIVEALAVALGGVLFAIPLILLGNGISLGLRTQEREMAVSRAIGVPPGTVSAALGLLTLRVVAWALAGAALLVAAGLAAVPGLLSGLEGLPQPVRPAIAPATAAAVALVALAATALAVGLAAWAHVRRDVANAIRA